MKPISPPLVSSNITGLADLAAAHYSVTTDQEVSWDDLDEETRAHHEAGVAYIVDIVLDAHAHNYGLEMTRIRADAASARGIAERRHHRRMQARIAAGLVVGSTQ